jgi:hypothetical protein
LRGILIVLNCLLGYCAVVGTFRPHFEILFALSLGLTACYALCVILLCLARSAYLRTFVDDEADLQIIFFIFEWRFGRFMKELSKLHPTESAANPTDSLCGAAPKAKADKEE